MFVVQFGEEGNSSKLCGIERRKGGGKGEYGRFTGGGGLKTNDIRGFLYIFDNFSFRILQRDYINYRGKKILEKMDILSTQIDRYI